MPIEIAPQSAFEFGFQDFLAHGGFTQPAFREDIEREYAQMERHKSRKCKHGFTILTCGTCSFEGKTNDGQ